MPGVFATVGYMLASLFFPVFRVFKVLAHISHIFHRSIFSKTSVSSDFLSLTCL